MQNTGYHVWINTKSQYALLTPPHTHLVLFTGCQTATVSATATSTVSQWQAETCNSFCNSNINSFTATSRDMQQFLQQQCQQFHAMNESDTIIAVTQTRAKLSSLVIRTTATLQCQSPDLPVSPWTTHRHDDCVNLCSGRQNFSRHYRSHHWRQLNASNNGHWTSTLDTLR